jgi:glycosyltransferase involved in cell wall biosynthesis
VLSSGDPPEEAGASGTRRAMAVGYLPRSQTAGSTPAIWSIAITRLPAAAIAFDVTPLQNAHRFRGIGTYVRGLAQRLSLQSEIPIQFWGWAGEDLIQVPPPHIVVGLPRRPMPEYRGAWLFAQLAMRRRAATSTVRAVHVTDPDALTGLPRKRLLTTVYDLIPLKQGVRRRSVIARAGYAAYLRALQRAATLFAISDETASDLMGMLRIPAARIVVARPGIDLPATASHPLSPSRPYFLFLGGPNPNKNLGVLVDAMALSTDLKEELLVAGHWLPRQVAALQAELKTRGLQDRIRHIGFVPEAELAELMTSATAMVIPSRYEGFGLPVGEGLAAGAVIVHSRIPVLEEVSAGVALAFGPDSAEELATCLRRVASDQRLTTELRRRGIQRAKELTWDAAVEATLNAYRATLTA